MPTILPFAVVPSAIATGLNFLKYGHFFTYGVRSASCPLSPSVRSSVNGTVETSGNVRPASAVAKLEGSHWYCLADTLMFGLSFWNAAIRALSCAWASALLPGRSPATVILIVFLEEESPAAATESARHAIASTHSAARVLRL